MCWIEGTCPKSEMSLKLPVTSSDLVEWGQPLEWEGEEIDACEMLRTVELHETEELLCLVFELGKTSGLMEMGRLPSSHPARKLRALWAFLFSFFQVHEKAFLSTFFHGISLYLSFPSKLAWLNWQIQFLSSSRIAQCIVQMINDDISGAHDQGFRLISST